MNYSICSKCIMCLGFTQSLHYGILMSITFGFVPNFKMYTPLLLGWDRAWELSGGKLHPLYVSCIQETYMFSYLTLILILGWSIFTPVLQSGPIEVKKYAQGYIVIKSEQSQDCEPRPITLQISYLLSKWSWSKNRFYLTGYFW